MITSTVRTISGAFKLFRAEMSRIGSLSRLSQSSK